VVADSRADIEHVLPGQVPLKAFQVLQTRDVVLLVSRRGKVGVDPLVPQNTFSSGCFSDLGRPSEPEAKPHPHGLGVGAQEPKRADGTLQRDEANSPPEVVWEKQTGKKSCNKHHKGNRHPYKVVAQRDP
jgi:hypothetical protein